MSFFLCCFQKRSIASENSFALQPTVVLTPPALVVKKTAKIADMALMRDPVNHLHIRESFESAPPNYLLSAYHQKKTEVTYAELLVELGQVPDSRHSCQTPLSQFSQTSNIYRLYASSKAIFNNGSNENSVEKKPDEAVDALDTTEEESSRLDSVIAADDENNQIKIFTPIFSALLQVPSVAYESPKMRPAKPGIHESAPQSNFHLQEILPGFIDS